MVWRLEFSNGRPTGREEPPLASMWVNLPSLPIQLFEVAFLPIFARAMGRFLRADHPTLSKTHPSCARICVEMDVSEELIEGFWVGVSKSKGFWHRVEYERVPVFQNIAIGARGKDML